MVLLSILCSFTLFAQKEKKQYDVAAFLYPAYASDDWLEAFDECAAIPTTLILVGRK